MTAPPAAGPTITISLEQHTRLRQDAVDAQLRAEALRIELETERSKTTEERLTEALGFIEAAKTIIDHACANLGPEFIKDLPAEAFEVAAQRVDKIMGATQRDSERAGVWRERAQLIQSWRDKRKASSWEDTVPVPISKPTARKSRAAATVPPPRGKPRR